jgi:hypothetical protein
MRLLHKYEDVIGYSALQINLSPAVRTDKNLTGYTKAEKSGTIHVYLCGREEETPEQVTFMVARQMAQLIAPDRIQSLVLRPAGREFEAQAKGRMQETVSQLPRYIRHREAHSLLEKKIKNNQELIDFQKFIYLLIEPEPLPAEAVKKVSVGLIGLLESNVNSSQAVGTQSPWEIIRLMALASVISNKIGVTEISVRSAALLHDAEFCHNLLQMELADQSIPLSKGKSIEPSEEEAQRRFLSIYETFLLAADGYYDSTTMPHLDLG